MLCLMLRVAAALALLTPLAARAELPRLVPLFDLEPRFLQERKPPKSALERSVDQDSVKTIAEPFVFWSHDGLICVPAYAQLDAVDCQDPTTGKHHQRKRPLTATPPMKSTSLNGAALSQDGTISNGEQQRVAKLRCARSPFLDRKEYRYAIGPEGLLAVIVLEEDDVRERCALLDAQCGHGSGKLVWRVLIARPSCPEGEP